MRPRVSTRVLSVTPVNPAFALLVSRLYDGALTPEHRADLDRSGLTDATIRPHFIRSVPPSMLRGLLGFDVPAVRSALLFPFRSPTGGFMDHVRVKIFPALTDARGHTTKYLGPKGAPPRLYFCVPHLSTVLESDAPVWVVEGAKKALAVTQLGLPAVGFEGVEAWHARGSDALLDDFTRIPLRARLVELVPDGDVQTNPAVTRAVTKFADALQARGARVRLRLLPIAPEVAA